MTPTWAHIAADRPLVTPPVVNTPIEGAWRQRTGAGPSAWNDPDFLQTGRGGMTATEYRTQFSLWALMAAPLIVSRDLRTLSPFTRETLANPEVLAVDQDPAGLQGTRVKDDGEGLEVWSRQLAEPNSRAVALFNRQAAPAAIDVTWADLGLDPDQAEVRDLWARQPLGTLERHVTATVPAHGVVLLRVSTPEEPVELSAAMKPTTNPSSQAPDDGVAVAQTRRSSRSHRSRRSVRGTFKAGPL